MTRRPAARAAFTLIELLVVIAIIAILIALVGPAVQKARGGGPRLIAKNEISQMDTACSTFKTKFGFYPPTQFTIPTRIDSADFQVFKRMFPRWNPALQADNVTIQTAAQPQGAGLGMTGNASLVYFLGGPVGTGWAIDAPVAPSAGAAAKNVFYDFPDKKRLTSLVPGAVYNDPWGTPYAYHGSVTGGNYPKVGSTGGVYPFQRNGKFENQMGVQIISAGENKAFGVLAPTQLAPTVILANWSPGAAPYATGQPGGDDMANFNEGKILGVN